MVAAALALAVVASAAVLAAGVWVARSDSSAAHAIVGVVRQYPVLRSAAHSVRAALAGVLSALPLAEAEPDGTAVLAGAAPGAAGAPRVGGAARLGVTANTVARSAQEPAPGSQGTEGAAAQEGADAGTEIAEASQSPVASSQLLVPTSRPPGVAPAAPGPRAELPAVRQQYQTMNNCGPAATAMALGFFGYQVSQEAARLALRPGGYDDKNVTPEEIAAYLAGFGLETRIRVAGDVDRLRTLLANGIPVVVHQLLASDPDKNDIGHYAVVRGYDDAAGVFISQDPYFSSARRLSYAEFDRLWRPFNRRYLPVYRPEEAPLAQAILGDDWDEQANWARAQNLAENEINRAPRDAFAWFTLGDSLLAQGDAVTATYAFEHALGLGLPRRHLWYQIGPIQAHNRAGDYRRALELAQRVLASEATLAEVQYERGVALRGLGQRAAALDAFRLAARYGPNLAPAHHMVAELAAQ